MDLVFPTLAAGVTENKLLKRCLDTINASMSSQSATTATGTISSAITLVNSASDTTQTLPSAVGYFGFITVKNIGAGVVTVDGAGSETIDGETTWHLVKRSAITIVSDGSNWHIIGWVPLFST